MTVGPIGFVASLCVVILIGFPGCKPSAVSHEAPPLALKEGIRETIQQNRTSIKFCYEQELTARPASQGRVVQRWYIHRSGEVAGVEILSSDIKSSSLHECMNRVVGRWQFEQHAEPKPVDVQYPWVFKSAHSE